MKHELEEKKKIAKEAELYGHDETEDPDVAVRDNGCLSQGSANSDYSGPTQKMGGYHVDAD